jgi:hypothetical protein
VFFVNLCLGWSLIGWFVAFIWACSGRTQREVVVEASRHAELLHALGRAPALPDMSKWSLADRQRYEAKRKSEEAKLVRGSFSFSQGEREHRDEKAAKPASSSFRSGMGYCQSCGKPRGFAAVKCVYCGDTQEVSEQPRSFPQRPVVPPMTVAERAEAEASNAELDRDWAIRRVPRPASQPVDAQDVDVSWGR